MSNDKTHPAKDAQNSEAPEGKNRSQRDEDTQAQTVGSQAQNIGTGATASDPAPNDNHGAVNPQDKPDLVDKMKQMERSGQIDDSAYRGERNDGDAEDPLGTLEPDKDRGENLAGE